MGGTRSVWLLDLEGPWYHGERAAAERVHTCWLARSTDSDCRRSSDAMLRAASFHTGSEPGLAISELGAGAGGPGPDTAPGFVVDSILRKRPLPTFSVPLIAVSFSFFSDGGPLPDCH